MRESRAVGYPRAFGVQSAMLTQGEPSGPAGRRGRSRSRLFDSLVIISLLSGGADILPSLVNTPSHQMTGQAGLLNADYTT
jgi:hypothetical protein